MQKYNLYLSSKDRVNDSSIYNPTFNINWSFLPDEYQLFNLDFYFSQTGMICKDYTDVNYPFENFQTLFFNGMKISSNLLIQNSYDTSTKCNSFTLGYLIRSQNLVSAGTNITKNVWFTCDDNIKDKVIIKPSGNLTFYFQNTYSLLKKVYLYSTTADKYLPNSIFRDSNYSARTPEMSEFDIVMVFTPIK